MKFLRHTDFVVENVAQFTQSLLNNNNNNNKRNSIKNRERERSLKKKKKNFLVAGERKREHTWHLGATG